LIARILGEIPPKLARISIKTTTLMDNFILSQQDLKKSETGESKPSGIVKSRYKRPEIKQESRLFQQPRDVLMETLYNLGYEDVVKTCATSQTLNKICEDERFGRIMWRKIRYRRQIKGILGKIQRNVMEE
jgi:hypothetical protein